MKLSTSLKWTVGVASVLAAASVSIPFFAGYHVQQVLEDLNGLRIPLDQGKLGTLEWSVSHLERHWWYSKASIDLIYHPEQIDSNEKPKPIISSQTEIIHGPLLWRPGAEERRPWLGQAWVNAPVNYVTDSLPERFIQVTGTQTGHISGYLSLLGDQKAFISTNEISFQDKEGQLNFSGFLFEVERSRNGKDMALFLDAPHFNFVLYPENDYPGVRWLIDGAIFQFSGLIENPDTFWFGSWLGRQTMTVDAIQVDIADQRYAVNQISFISDHKKGNDDQTMAGGTQMKIENIAINQENIGPIVMDVSFNNVDKTALEDSIKLYDGWFSSDSTMPFWDTLTPAQQDEVYKDLLKIVNRKPNYRINKIEMITDSGNVFVDGSFEIKVPAEDIFELRTPQYWEKSAEGAIAITASQSLVEDTATWALTQFYTWIAGVANLPAPTANGDITSPDGPVKAVTPPDYRAEVMKWLTTAQVLGYIKNENNNYSASAQYKDGIFTINDMPVIDLSGKSSNQNQ